ncbi:terminase large subunit domain-containing protein [Acinetobacter ursingii]|uniref:terminase large subunit domain-containing protein n=1 Tax=Acinetobacter ursingii TaxID=108980 RepID=UPI00244AB367|nr:terminase family protein [Acinetobacter ursingii]MDG9992359.1 terminase family protein [Acinetobacter ursingii]MDH0204350.1 terminase family protein [Acinetobacter ursingii]
MSELILPEDQPALQLYNYQKNWVQDEARFKIAMFARQCGKTFTSTLELALDCVKADLAGSRKRWVILSRGERQAREAMNEGVKLHLAAMQAGFQAYDYEWEAGIKALEVELPHGSKITALPANPDTARGFSANVLLDEFAFHQDSRAIWKALFPVISKPGLKLRVISTPNGKGNKFYELMTGHDDGWSRHSTDIYQAVADGLPRNIEELRKGAGDADLWAQEFELQWLDEASSWLDFELITSCEDELAGIPELYAGGMCYVGVDIAARNDLFVIWVIEQIGDVFWTREIIERKRISFAEQDMLLDDVFRRYRVVRCCMDKTGMGEKPVEDAQRRYGTSVVEGILFTSASKLNMATRGKEFFQDRRLRIPAGNNALRADLHKLKKVTSNTGTPRFVADSDSNGHADRTWAGFLAIEATDIGFQSENIITGRPRRANTLLKGFR